MSFTSRPNSPRLPTFGIRHLIGPTGAPGLVSISRSQYDSTLTSQPDAALLYIDDDDGEVITVGSSFELSQRLQEPVPIWSRARHGSVINKAETRDPYDGKLVHVFDIKQTSASLAEWRAHEAYSSKFLRPDTLPAEPSNKCDITDAPIEVVAPAPGQSSPTSLREPQEHKLENKMSGRTANQKPGGPNIDIISGIEEHLSGLADVLLLAANTLQRAADKTRETDTSVVEDVLYGVKGILTEVGSFGIDVLKEITKKSNAENINAEPGARDDETRPNDARTERSSDTNVPAEQDSTTEEFDDVVESLDTATNESTGPFKALSTSSSSEIAWIPSTHSESASSQQSKRSSRVTFDNDERTVSSATTRVREQDSSVQISDNGKQKEIGRISILDEPSEDADFTARYPPLNSVRRTRSTIEPRRPASPSRLGGPSWAWCPPMPPRPESLEKKEPFEAPRRPLPGAWPDTKNDAAPSESSGAFFNRMTGRVDTNKKNVGLHRANTTSSANPASRLTGPFDPGLPYQPMSSAGVALRKGTTPAWTPYRRPFGTTGSEVNDIERSPRETPLRSRRSVAYLPTLKPPRTFSNDVNINDSDVTSNYPKYGPHRGFKHYRSVPNFDPFTQNTVRKSQELRNIAAKQDSSSDSLHRGNGNATKYIPPPPRAPVQPIPMRAPPRFADALAARPDFLTGPSPSHPPPIPFTARPVMPVSATIPPPAPSFKSFAAHCPSFVPPPTLHTQPDHKSESPASFTTIRSDDSISETEMPGNKSTFSESVTPIQKNRFDDCVEQLKMCGFGIDDGNLRDRLHVYAVAANGDVEEAVEMIEEDRRMSIGLK